MKRKIFFYYYIYYFFIYLNKKKNPRFNKINYLFVNLEKRRVFYYLFKHV